MVKSMPYAHDAVSCGVAAGSDAASTGGGITVFCTMGAETAAAELGRSLLIKTVAIINHFIKVRHLYIIQSLTTV